MNLIILQNMKFTVNYKMYGSHISQSEWEDDRPVLEIVFSPDFDSQLFSGFY